MRKTQKELVCLIGGKISSSRAVLELREKNCLLCVIWSKRLVEFSHALPCKKFDIRFLGWSDILASDSERAGREIWHSPARTKAATRSSTSEDLMLILDGGYDFFSSTSSSSSSFRLAPKSLHSFNHFRSTVCPTLLISEGWKNIWSGGRCVRSSFPEQGECKRGSRVQKRGPARDLGRETPNTATIL